MENYVVIPDNAILFMAESAVALLSGVTLCNYSIQMRAALWYWKK